MALDVLPIQYNAYRSVKSFNKRVRFLILHYTAENFQDSINSLALGDQVSVHYLVADPTDATYQAAGFNGTQIFNLVDENDRAWHAGASFWAGRTNLNDASIGIENVNLASDDGHGNYTFPDYNPDQIDVLFKLIANIVSRYPDIAPTNVLAHSDVQVPTKSDPGPKFPWKDLYDQGIGAWYDEATKDRFQAQFNGSVPSRNQTVTKLGAYGYQTATALTDDAYYEKLIRAFQLHFRPANYSGTLDVETAAIAWALVDKYASAS